MSCPDQSCYDTTNPCSDNSPYYQDCGCLNPTTLQCVNTVGDFPNLGVTNDMNGLQALSAMNQKALQPFMTMTFAQRSALVLTPANIGLAVIQTDSAPGQSCQESLWIYLGITWSMIIGGGSIPSGPGYTGWMTFNNGC